VTVLKLEKHADQIVEMFANGTSMRQIAENLKQSGVDSGMDYDKGFHVRQILRARGRVAPARKRAKQESSQESSVVKCPHCGKPICPHCGKPV